MSLAQNITTALVGVRHHRPTVEKMHFQIEF